MAFRDGWNNRILIADDQQGIHQDFEEMLGAGTDSTATDDLAGAFDSDLDESFLPEFELIHAASGKEAHLAVKETIEQGKPIAVAYIDVRMSPGWDGIETIRKIRKLDKRIEIVIMTAYTDKPLSEIVHGMESLHKLLYIRKPFAREEVQQITISLTEKWNVERELMEKNRQLQINKQRLETVLDSTRDAIVMFDITGHLVFANRWYKKLFGLEGDILEEMSAAELRQRTEECFQESDRLEEAEASFFSNPEKVFEEIIEMRLPERRMLYLFMASVRDAGENTAGHIAVFRDVSKEIEIDQMKTEVLRLRSELEAEYSFDNIIGRSRKMREMYALMQQATQSNITVLVRGESGTGKELVARSIHFNSPRRSGPFVAVNCAAIPETLIESELFGHERGAFTGAAARRMGKFEQARDGTILLDEIGEMHLSLQTRLLRVLQEREIQRVGGTGTVPVDVRVIALTNKNLEDAMKAREFREDLFYRVSAFPITIPPLRERREDVSLLAECFLGQAAERSGKSITVVSTEALELLMNYDWPGNVRELENVIERAALLETSDVLSARSLPAEITSVQKRSHMPDSQDGDPSQILPLEEVEKQALMRALKVTRHNIRQTANVLGINRATVYRKLEKYDLLKKK